MEETAPLCDVTASPQRDVCRPQAQKWRRIDMQRAIALRLCRASRYISVLAVIGRLNQYNQQKEAAGPEPHYRKAPERDFGESFQNGRSLVWRLLPVSFIIISGNQLSFFFPFFSIKAAERRRHDRLRKISTEVRRFWKTQSSLVREQI